MAAPTFTVCQVTSAYASGSVTEFSTTSGVGAALGSLTAAINFSNSNGATGPQASNSWSAANPVRQGDNSYEFIWCLKVITAADNSIQNIKAWVPTFSAITGVTFFAGVQEASGFSTAVTTNSTKGSTNFTAINDQTTAYLPIGNISNIPNVLTKMVYMQARTTGAAAGGNQSGTPSVLCSLEWS